MRIGGFGGNIIIGGRGGAAPDPADMATITVAGAKVQFEKGDKKHRQVIVNGSMYITVGAGNQCQMNVGNLRIKSSGNDLYINGEKVDFTAGGACAPAKPLAEQMAELE